MWVKAFHKHTTYKSHWNQESGLANTAELSFHSLQIHSEYYFQHETAKGAFKTKVTGSSQSTFKA